MAQPCWADRDTRTLGWVSHLEKLLVCSSAAWLWRGSVSKGLFPGKSLSVQLKLFFRGSEHSSIPDELHSGEVMAQLLGSPLCGTLLPPMVSAQGDALPTTIKCSLQPAQFPEHGTPCQEES